MIAASNQNTERDVSQEDSRSLNSLINRSKQQDFKLKSAIMNDDEEAIKSIDAEVRIVEHELINYECANQQERKILFTYLIDRYMGDSEVAIMLPTGVLERIKELFR